jgi:anti-sigma B factor antagonist
MRGAIQMKYEPIRKSAMDMRTETIRPGVVTIVLVGRLDVMGAGKIDLQFNAIAGSHRGVIVDMGAVEFLASIGIRTLLSGAKTVQRRGGQFFLVAPQPDVMAVLESMGMLDLLPVVANQNEASALIGH